MGGHLSPRAEPVAVTVRGQSVAYSYTATPAGSTAAIRTLLARHDVCVPGSGGRIGSHAGLEVEVGGDAGGG